MIENYDIKWAPHIPLIGGFPIGAQKTIGVPPTAIISLPGFQSHDSHYVNHIQNTLGLKVPYNIIDARDRQFIEKLNIVVATPPCAGLSSMNTGTSKEKRGADAAANDYMYITAEQAIDCYQADVVIIENAPVLYTEKGKAVRDRLINIAHKKDYSISFYKTNTVLHGLPQRRIRTFCFMWRSDSAPILAYYNRKPKSFKDHLAEIHDDYLQQKDLAGTKDLINEPFFQFVNAYNKGNGRNAIVDTETRTALQYVVKYKLMNEALAFFKEQNIELGVHHATRYLKKKAMAKGIWDSSVNVYGDIAGAIISRNIADTIHPVHDRGLTYRECLHLMGFPHNFKFLFETDHKRNPASQMGQTVPTCTAADMVLEGLKFIRGDTSMAFSRLVMQDNIKQNIDYLQEQSLSLDQFFC